MKKTYMVPFVEVVCIALNENVTVTSIVINADIITTQSLVREENAWDIWGDDNIDDLDLE